MLSVCVFERDERALHVCRQDVRHSCTCAQFNQSPLFFRLMHICVRFYFPLFPFLSHSKVLEWEELSAFLFWMPYLSVYTIVLLLWHTLYSRPHPGGRLCTQAPHRVPFDSALLPTQHQTLKGMQHVLISFDPFAN